MTSVVDKLASGYSWRAGPEPNVTCGELHFHALLKSQFNFEAALFHLSANTGRYRSTPLNTDQHSLTVVTWSTQTNRCFRKFSF